MRSEQARTGARVRVGESSLRPEWRGIAGTISRTWGGPGYLAVDVSMEDGNSRLFWLYEVELVPELVAGRGPAELREKAGA